jgi:hypothetical protein
MAVTEIDEDRRESDGEEEDEELTFFPSPRGRGEVGREASG